MLIRHRVFLNIKANEKASFENDLREFCKKVKPELNCSDYNFEEYKKDNEIWFCFFIDFPDENIRNRYLEHEEHIKIAPKLIARLKDKPELAAKIIDYKINEPIEETLTKNEIKGYVLVNETELNNIKEQIKLSSNKIKKYLMIENVTVEDLGKYYPYFVHVTLNPGVKSVELSNSLAFWS